MIKDYYFQHGRCVSLTPEEYREEINSVWKLGLDDSTEPPTFIYREELLLGIPFPSNIWALLLRAIPIKEVAYQGKIYSITPDGTAKEIFG